MKYAVIALILGYLIVYGCSPDKPEKATEKHAAVATGEVVQTEHKVPPATEQQAAEHSATQEAQPAEKQDEATVPAATAVEQAQAAVEHQPATEQAQIVAAPDQMAENQPTEFPCPHIQSNQEAIPCPMHPQAEEVLAGQPDQDQLTIAMQRMVDATNNMVLVTRQLVVATQEMLNAAQNAAGEAVNTGKEIIEAQPEQQSQPAAQPQQ